MRVAALVPAYQAAAKLGGVLLRLQALDAPPVVLVVDDGSSDATAAIARGHGARVLSFPENRGKGHALLAGFAALRDEFDAVVTLDADGQHPPECLPDLVRAAEAGADLVLGVRDRTPEMPASRRFANGFSSAWASWLAGQRVSDSQCGYRLHTRRLLERTPLTPDATRSRPSWWCGPRASASASPRSASPRSTAGRRAGSARDATCLASSGRCCASPARACGRPRPCARVPGLRGRGAPGPRARKGRGGGERPAHERRRRAGARSAPPA